MSAANQNPVKSALARIASGKHLEFTEASAVFEQIMSGQASDAQIGALLMGFVMRQESPDEISALVAVLRSHARTVTAPEGAMDIVGTGGDGAHTLNISTATALIVAGCGVPVAKHGNKAFSSKSGAADILAEIGVNLEAEIPLVEQAIKEAKIGFLMAPRYHSAMRFVGPARTQMGIPTLFNLVGPMCNPANVNSLLVGCYDPAKLVIMAATLGRLGAEHCWVVHGSGGENQGLDELSISGPSRVCEYTRQGGIREFTVQPEDAGCKRYPLHAIRGGTPAQNAQSLRRLLEGETGAYREITIFNAAAALLISKQCSDLHQGADRARQAIDTGRAKAALEQLCRLTNGQQ